MSDRDKRIFAPLVVGLLVLALLVWGRALYELFN